MEKMRMTEVNGAIAVGGIDEKVLSKTLEQLRHHAYSYLYNLQKDTVDFHQEETWYRRLTKEEDDAFTMNRWTYYLGYNVSKTFIHPNYRLKFRRSPLYDKPITNEDINKNPNIFIYNYLVFINGYLDTSAKIRCKEDLTGICLSKDHMGEELAKEFVDGSRINILFLRNSFMFHKSIRKDALEADGNIIRVSDDRLKKTDKVFFFASKKNGLKRMYHAGKRDELGTYTVPDVLLRPFASDDTIELEILVVPNHLEDTQVQDGGSIQYRQQKMPIPKNNVLVFTSDNLSDNPADHGRLQIQNAPEKLTEKYPNVFTSNIMWKGANVDFSVFYWDNEANGELDFDNDLSKYMKLMNLLGLYRDGNVPNELQNYTPLKYSYDSVELTTGEFKDDIYGSILYKANKLNSVFKLWGYAAQLYHENMRRRYEGYILKVKDLDLPSKIRTSTAQDLPYDHDTVVFDKEHYVFIFVNYSSLQRLPYRFWIDGYRFVPEHVFMDGHYQYVYIPTSRVKADSLIEIERGPVQKFTFKQELTNNPTPFNVPNGAMFPFSSIVITDARGKYLKRSDFKFTVGLHGETVAIPNNSHMFIHRGMDIKVTGPSLDPTEYTFEITDVPMEAYQAITSENYTGRDINLQGKITFIAPDPQRIRIFKHGLLMSPNMYDIRFPEAIDGHTKIGVKNERYLNKYQIDYIPEGYKLVYSEKEISPKGLINLNGKLDKPFSNVYYDVYLNGQKLLPHQIEKVANFAIVLKDIKVLRNLAIYEKVAAANAFMFDASGSDLLSDLLLRNDELYKKALMDFLIEIEDDKSIPDVDSMVDEVENYIIELIQSYLQHKGVDAERTESAATFNKYHEFLQKKPDKNNPVMLIDANRKYVGDSEDADMVYFLAPQEEYEYFFINDPFFVREMNDLARRFRGYLDANVTREEHKNHTTVENSMGDVTLFSGHKNVTRFVSHQKMLGTD